MVAFSGRLRNSRAMSGTHFSWSRESPSKFRIRVVTPEVRSGTFLRLVAAIYLLHFDVVEGDLHTGFSEDGAAYSEDEFLVEALGEAADPARLGLLMESLLREADPPAELFTAHGLVPPERRSFFEAPPEIVCDDMPDGSETQFYIEALGRRGLLFHLASVIANRGINIVRGAVRTDQGGNAQDTLYLTRDGHAIGREEAAQLERDILGEDLRAGLESPLFPKQGERGETSRSQS